MQNEKPIVSIRMSAAALAELHSCEFGSYEDSFSHDDDNDINARVDEYADGTLHIVELIERSAKTVVHLFNQKEVDEFFGQTCSGTFSLYHPGVCLRVYNELLPHISDAVPEWIRKSPRIGF